MKERSLTHNAILNLIKQSLTIVFPLITFPYVSRVLGSSEFGKYHFATSIVSYFALLATFGLTNFAIREGARIRDDHATFSKLASELFSFNVLTTLVAYLGLFLLSFLNAKVNTYALLISMHSISILLTTIGLDWVNTVYEDFLYLTIRYIILQFLSLIAIFLFVRTSNDTLIYGIIMLAGSYGGNLLNLFYIRKYVNIHFTFKIPVKHFFLPMAILFINSLAVIIYVNSDITILGFFRSETEVGIYSFSSKIYNILKHLINAVIVVAVPRLVALLQNEKERYNQYLSTILNLLLLVLLPVATGVFVLSRSIILIVGGSEYLTGETTLKTLSFALIFALISSIYTNGILIIARLEKYTLIGTGISAILNIIGNLLLIPSMGISGAALTTVLAEFVNLMIQRYYSQKIIVKEKLLSNKTILFSTSGSFIVLIASLAANYFLRSNSVLIAIYRVIIVTLVSLVSYTTLLIIGKYPLVRTLQTKFLKRSE